MNNKAATNESKEKSLTISRGEKIFDWLVYAGIAGVGTFLLTLYTTHWSKYGGGAKYFNSGSNWLIKKGLTPQSAEELLMSTALMQGGNLAVLPVKWAEDNKIACIQAIDKVIGEKTDVSALEAEDKQSWSSILKARVLAWTTVFLSLKTAGHILGGDKFEAFKEGFSKHIVCNPLGKATHHLGKETNAFRYGKIAALDVFATAAASTLLYVGSRIFAHWERQKEEAQQTAHIAPHPAESHPQKGFSAISTPSKRTPAEIIKAKSPDGSFADAAMHSRAGEQMQLGA